MGGMITLFPCMFKLLLRLLKVIFEKSRFLKAKAPILIMGSKFTIAPFFKLKSTLPRIE